MRINCNFVTIVGLTNDERCLMHNLRVEKHWGSERMTKMFSNEWTHLWIINNKCLTCTNSINIWWFAVYVALYWRSWKRSYFYGPSGISLRRAAKIRCGRWRTWPMWLMQSASAADDAALGRLRCQPIRGAVVDVDISSACNQCCRGCR